MSVNTAHASNGVLLYAGECILLHSKRVLLQFFGQPEKLFQDNKYGAIFLTTHRIIFNNSQQADLLHSLSLPFKALTRMDVVEPLHGAGSFLKCRIKAQPNGNFSGKVTVKIVFEADAALHFAAAIKRAIKLVTNNLAGEAAYQALTLPKHECLEGWAEAPLPAYAPQWLHTLEWLPQHRAFTRVPNNSVFMNLNPAPYPGIGNPPRYEPANEPIPINTCTPCARYKSLAEAPGAIGFRHNQA